MAAKKSGKTSKSQDQRMAWWRQARFGMFIHWGLYAVPAGVWKGKEIEGIGEWIMNRAQIPVRKYEKLAKQFNPVKFDAEEWVGLAKAAGMKYIVITAKHHDGFAMYDSPSNDYNIVAATPFGRDPIAELARACKKAGIRLCFYYSQKQDWHHPEASGNTWDFPDKSRQNFNRYMKEKALPQVREILTQYGPIGLIWYDTPQDITPAQTRKFVDLVYEVQPDCLVDGRAGHGIGDYQSMGDNLIPPARLEGDWETPATLNDTWGFKKNDTNWKTTRGLLHRLVDIVGKGGNYLLNVGPTAEGVIPAPSAKRLREIGTWFEVNGEAIYGASASPYPFEQSWGSITSKSGRLYLHFVAWPGQNFALHGLKNKVKKAYLLAGKKALEVVQEYDEEIDLHTLRLGLPSRAPDRNVSVVALEIEGAPVMDEILLPDSEGRMVLEAYNARIRPAKKGSQLERGRFGTIENWFNTQHRVSWEFKMAAPGEYDVLILSQTEADGRWEGGHRVKVAVDRGVTLGVVRESERIENPKATTFLKDVVAKIGRVTIPRAGTHTLTLKVEKLAGKKKLGFKLRAVHLVPAAD